MEISDELRVRAGVVVCSEAFSSSSTVGDAALPLTLRRLLEVFASDPDSRRCNAQRRPLSTPVLRPTVPTVFATGEPMFRSMNSAPDLKRAEYDLDVVYAETDPLIAEEISGWEEVRSDKSGSGCGGSGEAAGSVCRDARGD